MRRRLLLPLFSLPLTIPAYADKRAFAVEDLYRVKSISEVQVSPNGNTLMYTLGITDLPRAKRISYVWMIGIDGGNNQQLTQSERGENAPRFSPDGKWISFVSSRGGSPNLYLESHFCKP